MNLAFILMFAHATLADEIQPPIAPGVYYRSKKSSASAGDFLL